MERLVFLFYGSAFSTQFNHTSSPFLEKTQRQGFFPAVQLQEGEYASNLHCIALFQKMMIHKLYEQNSPLPCTHPFHHTLISIGLLVVIAELTTKSGHES